ncbi:MAG: hypothetical protein EOO36_00470 [Cytophagaceae bacterium]|nr:MAG: hypothetical protein EOO36_00470 [Cytophagaceae bacterium]
MRVSAFTTLFAHGRRLGLLAALAACQPQPEAAGEQASAAHPPTGHFAGTLAVAGQPGLRAALEVRHPSPGHYDAELFVADAPGLSFVADTLVFSHNTLHLARPGQPGQTLTLAQQGDFWRGSLAVDSSAYPALLVRRGPPEPAVYRVRRDEVPGSRGPALLFSPADESLPGAALALFPTAATAGTTPAWADALARHGYTVLVLPTADTLTAPALGAALSYLRRTPGVDTARVGIWAAGPRANALATLLTQPVAPHPSPPFVVVQEAPAPDAAMRGTWRTLAQRQRVLGVYDAADATTAKSATTLRGALGRPGRILRGQGPGLSTGVAAWLREQ